MSDEGGGPNGPPPSGLVARLAELELAASGRPRFSEPGEYGLPQDTAEKAKGWAEGEGEKARIMEGIGAFNKDPLGTLEEME